MTSDSIEEDFDGTLSVAEREIIVRASEFGRHVVGPQAQYWDIKRIHPTETLCAACALNLAAIELSPEFGGLGLGFSAKMRVAEILANYDFGFAFSLVNHHNAVVRISQAASAVRERLLERMRCGEWIGCFAYTEPEHGSDLGRLETTATSVSGGWQLNGAKSWVTNAAVADVFLTLAQTDSSRGTDGIALFLVESDGKGFARQPRYELQGAHSIGAAGFELHRYYVPPDALLAPPGEAFTQSLAGINGARCYVAAMCAGMLDSAIKVAVQYTSDRTAFGQPIIEFQGLRWSLVDAAADLAALRLLTYRAARLIDAGRNAEEAAAAAKKFAGDKVIGHLSACVQALGANGLRSDVPLMRHLVAAKTACFTDGTTEMMNQRLGKSLVRRYRSP
jgi:alkylation response protein AidB-like acyl-CoA dehydrogenase